MSPSAWAIISPDRLILLLAGTSPKPYPSGCFQRESGFGPGDGCVVRAGYSPLGGTFAVTTKPTGFAHPGGGTSVWLDRHEQFLARTTGAVVPLWVYWLLIGRFRRDPPYFLRFHLLTALMTNGLLLLALLSLQAILTLVAALVQLLPLAGLPSMLYWVAVFWPDAVILLIWGVALWLSLAALMGWTPWIPVVTNNVRHWA